MKKVTDPQIIKRIEEARNILRELDIPNTQSKRSPMAPLALLALLNMKVDTPWNRATNPMIGIDEIRIYMMENFGVSYAPNTRENIRDERIQYFVLAGLARLNPDDPKRATNSKDSCYQVEENALKLIKTYGTDKWNTNLRTYLQSRDKLEQMRINEMDSKQVPAKLPSGKIIKLAPGIHSDLIKQIVEVFVPGFLHSDGLIFVDDTGRKETSSKRKAEALDYLKKELDIDIDIHGKIPDVLVHIPEKKWLVLIEAFTSVGPINAKRHQELTRLFKKPNLGLIFVTAFPNRKTMAKSLSEIDWQTEVWVADSPTHLVHFNGERFLGPYK